VPVIDEIDRGIATVRLDHGRVNAMDLELCRDLADTFDRLADDEAVSAIVLTGKAGAFSAGVDLRRILDGGSAYTASFLEALTRCFLSVFRVPVPTVAAVNGHAIAGGCVLACACDRRVLSSDDRLLVGLTELQVGVPFPTSAVEIVRGRTGLRFAEAIYHARNYPAAEALEIGFVDEVVEPGQVEARAARIAAELAEIPRGTYELTKRQVQRSTNDAIEAMAPQWEPEVLAGWTRPDARSAIARFLEGLRS
jgi:enoyl-CoA hydratase